MCVYVPCACRAYRGERRATGPLELELRWCELLCAFWDLGYSYPTPVLCKSNRLVPLNHPSSPDEGSSVHEKQLSQRHVYTLHIKRIPPVQATWLLLRSSSEAASVQMPSLTLTRWSFRSPTPAEVPRVWSWHVRMEPWETLSVLCALSFPADLSAQYRGWGGVGRTWGGSHRISAFLLWDFFFLCVSQVAQLIQAQLSWP